MRLCRSAVLIWALSAAVTGTAGAAPLTTADRNAIVDKVLDGLASTLIEDYTNAIKPCEEARAIAQRFDEDDWALGHVDGCFAMVAEAKKEGAAACALRASQIAHFERVAAAGTDELKKNVAGSLKSAKTARAALQCR